ncbi:unnamed protein product [Paramecium pentaurelia]|uniref:Uncharacterized protein n=1 Tax=Paramecium pentaurelia TaxID=43138 RepID=A0A8S1YPT7_9CILI|nr:unnamed protein product [Paramecium pentaurelia]
MLIALITITCGQILYQENFKDNSFVDNEGWQVYNANQSIGYCNQTKLFGGFYGFHQNTTITKFITLPPHYAIMITLEFWKIDCWDDEYFYIYADGESNVLKKVWNVRYKSKLVRIKKKRSVFILMTSKLKDKIDEWWGIRHFKLYIYQCPPRCQICASQDSTIVCLIWVAYYQSLLNEDINQFQMEGWIILEGKQSISSCSSIPILGGLVKNGQKSKIIKSINLPVHSQIKIKFKFIFIDKWDSEYAQLYVDHQLIWNYSHKSITEEINFCGGDIGDKILNQEINLPHKQQLLELQFTTLANQFTDLSFGIRDVEIFIGKYIMNQDCPFGFPYDFICEGICGNGEIDKAEQCDDGNIYPFDGCFNCQYSCIEGCSNCIQGICFECQEGWTFYEFSCTEEFLINYQDQQQQCLNNCKLCINGMCQECDIGFYLINNQCQTICGDGIMAGHELCELEEQDCQNCQFICSKNCDVCIEGECQQCIIGYTFDYIEKYCQPICGNGVVSDDEECDDFNIENGDGCSTQCKIEQNYICKNYQNSYSECSYEKQPAFKLSLTNIYYQYQYVSIYFYQMVKTKSQNVFSKMIRMRLTEPNEIIYDLNLIPIQEPFELVSVVEYLIEIQINTTLSQPPILEVTLEDQLFNNNDAPLVNKINQIKLNIPQQLDDHQKQNAIYLKEVAKYTIISMGGSAVLILILCGSLIIQDTLEILQQQSYLRFINVVFPLNLFIYFESSNLISMQPILDKIKIDKVLTSFMNDQYLQSQGKLLFYELNADILCNIQTQVFLIIVLMMTYYSNYLVIKLIRKLNNQQFFYFGSYIAKFQMKVLKSMQKFKRNFERQAFQDFLITNSWDLLFMSFLQIFSKTNRIVSYLIAYLIFYISLILSSTIFSRIRNQIIRSTKQLWIAKSNQIKLLKKILFISILVMFQQNQKLQIMLLTLICQFYLIYLLIMKPFQNNIDYINTMALEISSFIFCFSSALYWNDLTDILEYSIQIQFAWFQIGMLLSCLFINFVSQLCMICVELKKKVVKNIKKYYPQQNQMQVKINPFFIP